MLVQEEAQPTSDALSMMSHPSVSYPMSGRNHLARAAIALLSPARARPSLWWGTTGLSRSTPRLSRTEVALGWPSLKGTLWAQQAFRAWPSRHTRKPAWSSLQRSGHSRVVRRNLQEELRGGSGGGLNGRSQRSPECFPGSSPPIGRDRSSLIRQLGKRRSPHHRFPKLISGSRCCNTLGQAKNK